MKQLVEYLEANIPGGAEGWEFVGCGDTADCDKQNFFNIVGWVNFNLTESQMSSGVVRGYHSLLLITQYMLAIRVPIPLNIRSLMCPCIQRGCCGCGHMGWGRLSDTAEHD